MRTPEHERNPLVLFLAELGAALAERERDVQARRANMQVVDGRAGRVNRRQRRGDAA